MSIILLYLIIKLTALSAIFCIVFIVSGVSLGFCGALICCSDEFNETEIQFIKKSFKILSVITLVFGLGTVTIPDTKEALILYAAYKVQEPSTKETILNIYRILKDDIKETLSNDRPS